MQHEAHTFSVMLDADEALVLFEFLSRWSNDGKPLEVADAGEATALDAILAQLEKQLVDPFRADYAERLQKARAELRRRGGAA
jgi:hypothetical protein